MTLRKSSKFFKTSILSEVEDSLKKVTYFSRE
jgi:hypothetical protein